jgi:hypothetical protein
MKMATITHPTIATTYTEKVEKQTLLNRFINWSEDQEQYRFGWVAGILAGHGCIITPITLFAIILSGSNLVFFIAAIIAMMASLVTNLAALPTKYTIPTFVLSIVIDLIIVISCAIIGFDISGTYI